MEFNIKLMYGLISKDTVWLRIWNKSGIHFTKLPMLFSERNGRVKYFKLFSGWRFKLLPIKLIKHPAN